MSNEQSHHEHAQDAFIDALFEESPINIAALLRACADGELNPEQCERLEALLAEHPEAAAQHDFEEKLRACCKRSMTRPGCPQALRDRVGAIAASSAANAAAEEEAYADRIEGAGSYTTSRSFWARSPLMGVAAVLLLSVAGVLIWQSTSLVNSSGGGIGQIDQVSYTERVGNFAAREHKRCCIEEAAQRKFTERDIAQTVSYFSDQFQRAVATPDMNQHAELVEFYGAGDCAVPMTSQSGHLRFDAIDPDGNQITMSLFISPDPGLLEMDEGVTYRVSSKACDEAGANLFMWVSDGIQYVLVSEAKGETCSVVRSVMNAPENLSSI
jgi:anti-sigma factor RsiW